MRSIEISKGKLFLIICISILIFFIGNKIYTNKVIKNMEKQVSNVIEPVIERIKLSTIEEMVNGEKIENKYTIKFKSVEISPYGQENIKKILRGRAYVEYAICDEEETEWSSSRLTIPVRRDYRKGEFKIDWTKIDSRFAHDFFVMDIINDFENKEYSNYEEFIKLSSTQYIEHEEKYSEHSGSGSHNGDEIEFDENGNLIKGDKFEHMMTWTGAIVTMKFQSEYNLKEFTGDEPGEGIIINIKKTSHSKNPLWFAEINDIEKIDFWRDKEDGTGQESIEISEVDKIEKVLEVLSLYEYEYMLNEEYYKLTDGIKTDLHISFKFKNSPYFDVIINENGVFVSNQQVIISSEKSREILEKLMKIALE